MWSNGMRRGLTTSACTKRVPNQKPLASGGLWENHLSALVAVGGETGGATFGGPVSVLSERVSCRTVSLHP